MAKKGNKNYMKPFPSFGDALSIDQSLYQLAAYDSSDGMILIPESGEQAFLQQKKIATKFNFFKRLIQNSEASFNDIQQSVVMRSGPYSFSNRNLSPEAIVEKAIKDSEHSSKNSHDKKDDKELDMIRGNLVKTLQKMFQDIVEMSGENPKILNPNQQVFPMDALEDEDCEDCEDCDLYENDEVLEDLSNPHDMGYIPPQVLPPSPQILTSGKDPADTTPPTTNPKEPKKTKDNKHGRKSKGKNRKSKPHP